MKELERRLHKMGMRVWRSYSCNKQYEKNREYDLDFEYIWVIELNKGEYLYIEYNEDALRGAILSIERDMKLQELGL
jgi:hypothetical protein